MHDKSDDICPERKSVQAYCRRVGGWIVLAGAGDEGQPTAVQDAMRCAALLDLAAPLLQRLSRTSVRGGHPARTLLPYCILPAIAAAVCCTPGAQPRRASHERRFTWSAATSCSRIPPLAHFPFVRIFMRTSGILWHGPMIQSDSLPAAIE